MQNLCIFSCFMQYDHILWYVIYIYLEVDNILSKFKIIDIFEKVYKRFTKGTYETFNNQGLQVNS